MNLKTKKDGKVNNKKNLMKKILIFLLLCSFLKTPLVNADYKRRQLPETSRKKEFLFEQIKDEFNSIDYEHVTYTKSVYEDEFNKYVKMYKTLKKNYVQDNAELNKLLGIVTFRIGYHIYTDWISSPGQKRKDDYLTTILPNTNENYYYPESIKLLKQARQLGLDDSDITYYLGWSYLHSNQHYLAKIEFEKLLKYSGEEQKAHYGLFLVYSALEEYDKSKEELVLAYQANPDSDYLVDGTKEWALSIIAGKDKMIDMTYKKSVREELNEYRRNDKGVYIAVILQDLKIINNLKGLVTQEWADSTAKLLVDEFIKDTEMVISSPNSAFGIISIVERNNIKAVLDEINFSYTEYISDENRIKIGELVGATHLFSLSFIFNFEAEKIGTNIKINGGFWARSKLIEVRTGKIVDMYEWPYSPLPE